MTIKAVDYFCGAGGWSTGVSQAGVSVVAAVNHWRRAVESHTANHPGTKHYCQDAALLDPASLPPHDVLIASPSCQGHSKARGTDKPRHDASRATAWCVVNAAEINRPAVILVENVTDFREWALYPEWSSALRKLGYSLSENVLNAMHFGVPQDRVRLYIVAVRHGGVPTITIPKNRPVVPVRDIIDWSAGEWSRVADKAASTQVRVADGYRRGWQRFLISYYGSGSGLTARSIDRPVGTITTLARWGIVDGDRMRMLSIAEQKRAMSFPPGYVLTGTLREQGMQLGNAVCPAVATEIARQVLVGS